jgi:hypothetical protein
VRAWRLGVGEPSLPILDRTVEGIAIKSSFDVPGKLKMKFSPMSQAGAYAPTTHAPPGGNFMVSIVSRCCACARSRGACRPADSGWAVFDRQK